MRKQSMIAVVIALLICICTTQPLFAQPKYEYTENPQGYPWDLRNTEYFKPVKSLMDRNIIMGNPDGYFRPEEGLTRAELAVMLAKITGYTKNRFEDLNLNYFDDLAGYEWAKPYIVACKRDGLIKGRTEKSFDPGAKVSYIEYMAVISRLQNPQLDLPGKWPQNYIMYVQSTFYNVIQDRNITDWNAPAKRGDVAMILYNCASKKIAYELTEKEKLEKTELVRMLYGPEPAK